MISVIVATMNRATLSRTIASVRAQETTYPYEIIVAHGDRADDVRDISRRRNECAVKANGSYLAILDDDDYWKPNYISSILPYFQVYDVILSAYEGMGMPSLPKDLTAYLRSGASFPGGCLTVRTDAFFSVEGFNESLPHSEIWELLLKLSGRKVVYSPKYTWYRTMDNSYHAGQQVSQRKITEDRVTWQSQYVL